MKKKLLVNLTISDLYCTINITISVSIRPYPEKKSYGKGCLRITKVYSVCAEYSPLLNGDPFSMFVLKILMEVK